MGPGTQQLGSYAVPIGLMLLALATLLAGMLTLWCVVAPTVGGVLSYLSKFMIWSPLLGAAARRRCYPYS